MTAVPELRIREANFRRIRSDGRWVLYWMTANRRMGWNLALDRAVDWARELGRPVVVLEHLPCGNRWDTDRSHGFVLQGMAEHAAMAAGVPVTYYPYVESRAKEGESLVLSLAAEACVVVADERPQAEHCAMVDRVAAGSSVLVEAVDSNGLLPLAAKIGRASCRERV